MRTIYLLGLILLAACSGNQTPDTDHNSDSEVIVHSPEIVGEEMSYVSDTLTMMGYLAYDKNLEGKRPGVLVVHEWWGRNEHTRNAARKLAEAGYVAFALDMYGEGKQAEHPDDAGAFAGAVMSDFPEARKRFQSAMDILKRNDHTDADHVAAIGYCFGGGVVLNLARQGADLDAVASFHGSISPIEEAQPGVVKARVLVMNGEEDPFVSDEAIEALKAEFNNAGVDYEFINYPGAVHAFTNPGATAKGEEFGLPLAYNAEADSASWAKLESFLGQVFSK